MTRLNFQSIHVKDEEIGTGDAAGITAYIGLSASLALLQSLLIIIIAGSD